MRHGKKFNHLGRTASHRNAMLSNMASSLILNKRISTTTAKAKALRKYVEPLLTKAKDDTTHSRRTVFSYLNDKESVKTLFDEIAEKIATRPGGYTRILKTGNRLGDNADMCIIELVDYNEALLKESSTKTKTRRSRRGGKAKAKEETAESAEAKVETAAAPEKKSEVKEEAKPEKKEEAKAETAPATETKPEEKEAKTKAVDTSVETKQEQPENKSDSGEQDDEKKDSSKK